MENIWGFEKNGEHIEILEEWRTFRDLRLMENIKRFETNGEYLEIWD